MRRLMIVTLCLIPAALALASPSRAAAPAARAGWTFGLHVGAGKLSMDGDSLQRDVGVVTHLHVGYFAYSNAAAGLDARSWSAVDSSLTRKVQILTTTATWYPWAAGFATGLYVRGGAGVAVLTQEFFERVAGVPQSSVVIHEDNGFAATVACGYERFVFGRFGLGAEIDYAHLGFDGGDLGGLASATVSGHWRW